MSIQQEALNALPQTTTRHKAANLVLTIAKQFKRTPDDAWQTYQELDQAWKQVEKHESRARAALKEPDADLARPSQEFNDRVIIPVGVITGWMDVAAGYAPIWASAFRESVSVAVATAGKIVKSAGDIIEGALDTAGQTIKDAAKGSTDLLKSLSALLRYLPLLVFAMLAFFVYSEVRRRV